MQCELPSKAEVQYKLDKVLKSCKTPDQCRAYRKMLENAYKRGRITSHAYFILLEGSPTISCTNSDFYTTYNNMLRSKEFTPRELYNVFVSEIMNVLNERKNK